MISLLLAFRLHDAGLEWIPARADHFVIPQPDLQYQVFLVSDMTVEAFDLPTGRIIRFNGTTEWALDSVEQRETVWLPGETQLRTRLGDAFVRLERTEDGVRVVIRVAGEELTFQDPEADEAYGEALLHLLTARKSV